jgi:hypothetical protein
MKSKWYKIIATIFLIVVLFAKAARSQSCAGEIVHFRETFGTGTGNAPLAAGRTNYIYNGANPLSDGDYRLSNNSQGRPEWHSAPDHTGNTNGRMMITNASYSPGEFYRDTVWVLPSNTFYSVYLYVMNLNKTTTCGQNAILPKLEFIVESYNSLTGTFTHLTSFTSGFFTRTENPTWVLTGGFFTLPSSVTAVRYRILNNSTGGCGNDLAIDDITFGQCASLMLPVTNMQFSAQQTGTGVTINWSTAQENNTDKFVIEKSSDGKNWDAVNVVKAAGHSNSVKHYSTMDNNPYQPQTYYRVLQVDIDGKFSYSPIELVKTAVTGNRELSGYPNPFKTAVKLELNSADEKMTTVRITDINGRIVKTTAWLVKKGHNSINVPDVSTLNSGVYFAIVNGNDGTILAKTKLVKL